MGLKDGWDEICRLDSDLDKLNKIMLKHLKNPACRYNIINPTNGHLHFIVWSEEMLFLTGELIAELSKELNIYSIRPIKNGIYFSQSDNDVMYRGGV